MFVQAISSVAKCAFASSVLNLANYVVPEALLSRCTALLSGNVCSNLHLECVMSPSHGPSRLQALAPKPRSSLFGGSATKKKINTNETAGFDPLPPLASSFGARHPQASRPSHYKQCRILFFPPPLPSNVPLVWSINRQIYKGPNPIETPFKPLITFKSQ